MRRRAMIVAVWIAGTVASVALAWSAVSVVGGEVSSTPSSGRELAAAGVTTSSTVVTTAVPGTTPTTNGASTSPTTGPAPAPTGSLPVPTTTATTAPPPAERRSEVFESIGGTMGASCTGATASLDFATPRAGYTAEVHDPGPTEIDVRFDAGSGVESRIEVRCVDGTPAGSVREDG